MFHLYLSDRLITDDETALGQVQNGPGHCFDKFCSSDHNTTIRCYAEMEEEIHLEFGVS